MIAKLTTGNGFGGALRYAIRAGQDAEPEQVKVLDASGVRVNYDEDCNLEINTSQVSWDFRKQVMNYTGKKPIRKPVYHWALSYSPKDNVSESQMVEDAKDFMSRIGFVDTQYVMTAHYDKQHHHLHIISNIVNNKGKRLSSWKLVKRAHEASAAITKERGYVWGEKAQKKTIEKAHKPHEKVRYILKSIVSEAIVKAKRIDDLPGLLQVQRVGCKIKYSSEGRPVGISFSCKYNDQLHTFRGSQLDRRLSSSNIVKSIDDRLAQEETRRKAEPAPEVKTIDEFKFNYNQYRVRKEANGVLRLQRLEWDKSSPVDASGKYTRKLWRTKADCVRMKKIGSDTSGVYFQIQDLKNQIRYINQAGVEVSAKILHQKLKSGLRR